MPVAFYADVHVPGPVILQLRLRGIDILAATEELTNRLPDDELLSLSTRLGRVLVTQDLRFREMAYDWVRSNRPFAGLIFAKQRFVSYAAMIADLQLIAEASDPSEWPNRVENLPL